MELEGVPEDTHPEVRRRQIEGLRAMSPSERLELTMALCRSAEELAFAGMRLRDGDLPLSEMRRRLAVQRYGAELVRRVEAYRERLHAQRSLADIDELELEDAS